MTRFPTTALAALAAILVAAAPAAAKDKGSSSSPGANGGSSNGNGASNGNGSSNSGNAGGLGSSGGAGAATSDPSSQWGGGIELLTETCHLTGGCLFSGNDNRPADIAAAYTAAFPLSQLSLSLVQKIEFQGSQYDGSWSNVASVSFVSVKAGNQFMLYVLGAPATSGAWSTAGLVNAQGIAHAVSHVSLWAGTYDSGVAPPASPEVPIVPPLSLPIPETPSAIGGLLPGVLAVPEPSTWLTMILGFGGIGAVLRRRRALVAA